MKDKTKGGMNNGRVTMASDGKGVGVAVTVSDDEKGVRVENDEKKR